MGGMKFESTSMGNVGGGSFTPPRKVYSVGEDEEPELSKHAEPELVKTNLEEYAAQRAKMFETSKKSSVESKGRLEYLLGLGRIKDTMEVDGVKFGLQSLRTRELESVWEEVIKLGDTESKLKFQFELRIQTLARALVSVDDMPFEMVLGKSTLDDKMVFLRELDENVIDFLYSFYQKNIVDVGKDKYSIKSKEDAKEVSEEIKK